MYAELKYRLRAGFKDPDFTTDMKKAMNYHSMRKEANSSKSGATFYEIPQVMQDTTN